MHRTPADSPSTDSRSSGRAECRCHLSIIDPFLAPYVGRKMRLDPSPLFIAQPKQVAAHSSVLLVWNHYPGNRFIEF
jgi:hypothetical protein